MNPYTEDALVERPAISLFRQLGWETANCFDEILGDAGRAITDHHLFGGQQRKNAIAASQKRDGERSPSTNGRRVYPQYTP